MRNFKVIDTFIFGGELEILKMRLDYLYDSVDYFVFSESNKTHNGQKKDLILYRTYNPIDYPKYDNYDAINIDKTKDIPMDYKGEMGVPITFLDKYNPDQFEIIGIDEQLLFELKGKSSRFYLNGKKLYARIVIRNKKL